MQKPTQRLWGWSGSPLLLTLKAMLTDQFPVSGCHKALVRGTTHLGSALHGKAPDSDNQQ